MQVMGRVKTRISISRFCAKKSTLKFSPAEEPEEEIVLWMTLLTEVELPFFPNKQIPLNDSFHASKGALIRLIYTWPVAISDVMKRREEMRSCHKCCLENALAKHPDLPKIVDRLDAVTRTGSSWPGVSMALQNRSLFLPISTAAAGHYLARFHDVLHFAIIWFGSLNVCFFYVTVFWSWCNPVQYSKDLELTPELQFFVVMYTNIKNSCISLFRTVLFLATNSGHH